MIFGCDVPLVIGQRYEDYMMDACGDTQHLVPYVVLRQSTREEWLEGFLEAGGDRDIALDQLEATEWANFYEVSVD